RHCLGVVFEDVGSRLDDGAHRVEVALKIWRQDLDRCAGAAAPDGADGAREDAGPAIFQVVAVDRGDDRMPEAELGDRVRDSQRLRRAHSRMLPGVHSSSLFFIVPKNGPAIIPSMIRWSKLRHMVIMWRIAIASSITTARLTIDSVVRIAACGWLMMGWLAIDPVAPVLLSVNVP